MRSNGPTGVSIQSWGDRADYSIGWVDPLGGFTDMMTKLKMLAVYRNRLMILPPSNYERAESGRPRSDRTTDRCWHRRHHHLTSERLSTGVTVRTGRDGGLI